MSAWRNAAALLVITILGFAGPGARAATLIHTNDVLGELEPCGCRNNPQGGLARKANLLKKLPDTSLVQLDAGDLLFPTDRVPELLAPQSELQAARLLQAHELLRHDAIVPGEKDFALGFHVFEKLRKASKVPFLAANLQRKSGGRFLPAHLILTRRGSDGKKLRIAIFGLVGDSLSWPRELRAMPTIPSARDQLKELRKKADLVIALTHQGYEKDRELAEKVPGIDVIVGGHTQTFLQKPMRVGKTLVLQSSFRNQYVGVLPLDRKVDPEKYQLIGLDAGYESPQGTLSSLDEHVARFKREIAELNSREGSAGAAVSDGPKFQTFPRCAECHSKQFEFWRGTRHARAFSTLFEKNQNMNKDCLGCHTVGLGARNGFTDVNRLVELESESLIHTDVRAFLDAMSAAKSTKDPIRVKSTDPQPLPLRDALQRVTRAWTPVQCENCHSPAGDHPFSGTYTKTVEKELCLKCHTQDRAPAWYTPSGQPDWKTIDAKRARISCPAGELSPEE